MSQAGTPSVISTYAKQLQDQDEKGSLFCGWSANHARKQCVGLREQRFQAACALYVTARPRNGRTAVGSHRLPRSLDLGKSAAGAAHSSR
jgi:hypothetical protein